MATPSTRPAADSPPWSAPDSIGHAAWNRLVPPGVVAVGGASVLGAQATSIHDRHMSFVDSLSVAPLDQEGATAVRRDDTRVFRRAAARGVVIDRDARPVTTARAVAVGMALPVGASGQATSVGVAQMPVAADAVGDATPVVGAYVAAPSALPNASPGAATSAGSTRGYETVPVTGSTAPRATSLVVGRSVAGVDAAAIQSVHAAAPSERVAMSPSELVHRVSIDVPASGPRPIQPGVEVLRAATPEANDATASTSDPEATKSVARRASPLLSSSREAGGAESFGAAQDASIRARAGAVGASNDGGAPLAGLDAISGAGLPLARVARAATPRGATAPKSAVAAASPPLAANAIARSLGWDAAGPSHGRFGTNPGDSRQPPIIVMRRPHALPMIDRPALGRVEATSLGDPPQRAAAPAPLTGGAAFEPAPGTASVLAPSAAMLPDAAASSASVAGPMATSASMPAVTSAATPMLGVTAASMPAEGALGADALPLARVAARRVPAAQRRAEATSLGDPPQRVAAPALLTGHAAFEPASALALSAAMLPDVTASNVSNLAGPTAMSAVTAASMPAEGALDPDALPLARVAARPVLAAQVDRVSLEQSARTAAAAAALGDATTQGGVPVVAGASHPMVPIPGTIVEPARAGAARFESPSATFDRAPDLPIARPSRIRGATRGGPELAGSESSLSPSADPSVMAQPMLRHPHDRVPAAPYVKPASRDGSHASGVPTSARNLAHAPLEMPVVRTSSGAASGARGGSFTNSAMPRHASASGMVAKPITLIDLAGITAGRWASTAAQRDSSSSGDAASVEDAAANPLRSLPLARWQRTGDGDGAFGTAPAGAVRAAEPTSHDLSLPLAAPVLARDLQPAALAIARDAFAASAPYELPAAAAMPGPTMPPSALAPHAAAPSPSAGRGAEADVDDLVERAWQTLMSRLAIEQERRGFGRWS